MRIQWDRVRQPLSLCWCFLHAIFPVLSHYSAVPILLRGQGRPPSRPLYPLLMKRLMLLTPQRDWPAFYSLGHEIQQNFEQVARKYNARQYIQLNHEVVRA